ncbi:hypothetical protein C819_00478 [Lachnospiraceae bacterium 10-1]|nr:hypothetical protein C819_00478 [Lachnospiraceae bacterium 10-1]
MNLFGNKNDNAMAAAVEAANQEEETMERNEAAGEAEESKVVEMPKRKPFALWEVGGQSYKLKLKTSAIVELESKYKTNLMNIMGSGQGGMPALSVMLDVAHAAMKDWNHGITKNGVMDIFNRYIEEGGSQLSFYMTVYMEIFTVSGFFSVNLSNQMGEALQEAQETM